MYDIFLNKKNLHKKVISNPERKKPRKFFITSKARLPLIRSKSQARKFVMQDPV